MKESETFDQIDLATIDSLQKEYPNVVRAKLNKLDDQRYNVIPTALKKQKEDVSLSKSEVATLVDWKLSHGKWRPTLQGLVQRNADTAVLDTTSDAFKSFSAGIKSADAAKQAINTLSKLQGIGPATASLLLSVFDSDTVPFFSDELFRWCFFEDGKGKGWDREIKYNVKEYVELYGGVQQLRERLKRSSKREISAMELEKVAYVLGKTAMNGGSAANGKKRKAETESDDVDGETPFPTGGSKDDETKTRKSAAAQNPKKANAAKKVPSKAVTLPSSNAAANRPKRTRK